MAYFQIHLDHKITSNLVVKTVAKFQLFTNCVKFYCFVLLFGDLLI